MKTRDEHQDMNFIDPKDLFRRVGSASGPPQVLDASDASDTSDTSNTSRLHILEDGPEGESAVPKITRLPEGIEVIEQKVGRAIGNWILQVRCQCGRRWFELAPVEATHCPRCGMYVYIDVVAGGGPKG